MKPKDNAVSELIGALLLIGVLAGVFAILTVMLVSQPLPVQAPAVEFNLSIEEKHTTLSQELVIEHRRGDSFSVFDGSPGSTDENSEFYVMVDRIPYPIVKDTDTNKKSKAKQFRLEKSSTKVPEKYTIGDKLRAPWTSSALPNVQFIEKKPDGSEYLLWEKNPSVGSSGSCLITPSFISIVPDTGVQTNSGPSPLLLKFIDTSSIYGCSGLTWNWDLGYNRKYSYPSNRSPDNQTYNQSTPVSLIICDDRGYCTDPYILNIEVTSPPCTDPDPVYAKFTTDKPMTTHEKELHIQFFDDESTGRITMWNWNFDNNQSFHTTLSQDPIVHFTEGNYSVSLQVANECSYSEYGPYQVSVGQQKDRPCEITPTIIASPTSGTAPLTVSFTDSSSTIGGDIISNTWELGDGTIIPNTSTVVHTFTQAGIYQVNLTVTNDCGKSSPTFEIISVECPEITAGFTTNSSQGSAPLIIAFNGTASSDANITRYEWYFGDNTTNSTHQAPVHTFNAPGEYQVLLTAFNECGQHDSVMHPVQVTCPPVTAGFSMNQTRGRAPFTIEFIDTSTSWVNISSWLWDFGDGNTSSTQGPHQHTYYNPTPGDKEYTINLTAENECRESDQWSGTIIVESSCTPPTASFVYSVIDYVDFEVRFTDTSDGDPFEISSWNWDFGDGSTSSEPDPVHYYGGIPRVFTVTLTVTNECGESRTTQRLVDPGCQQVIPGMSVEPETGDLQTIFRFNDISSPLSNITSWRWLYGDGKSSPYITNPALRNTTHVYDKIGTYYATLMVENNCGQAFTQTKLVTIASPIYISGHLWEDWNLNKIQDFPGERNLTSTTGFSVSLYEITGIGQNLVQTTTPDANGNYQFSLSAVSGIYQVVVTTPSGQTWRSTVPYDSEENAQVTTARLPIFTKRTYTNQDFGFAEWHTSNVTIPLCFKYNPRNTWRDQCTATLQWDYRTSFNDTVKVLTRSGSDLIPDIRYSAWGRSNFTIFPEVYNIYFKDGSSGFYFLSWWQYDGVNISNQINLSVPDQTYYDRSRLTYWFPGGSSVYFVISQPREMEVVPYSSSSYIEAHYVGPFEDRNGGAGGCYIRAINNTPVNILLPYRASYGYNYGNWDNTAYEGKTVTLLVNNTLTNGTRLSTTRTVKVDWQLISASITRVQSETGTNLQNNRGNVTVNATVFGKNRDVSNVTLLINNADAERMTVLTNTTTQSTYSVTFDAEQYAGMTFPIAIQAAYLPHINKTVTSSPRTITCLSKRPLVANFTADPWSGPAPLEITFRDNSTGGANQWLWDFGDGTTSTLQNPVKTYNAENVYNVVLNIRNATSGPVAVTRQVNISGRWHDVMFYTTRTGLLQQDGWIQWITSGSNSYQVVNGTRYPFKDGDTVRNTVKPSQTTARILIAGEITDLNLTNSTLSINGAQKAVGNTSEIQLEEMRNFHSSLNLTANASKTATVSLIWDGVPQQYNWRNNIVIYDLMPTTVGVMELNMSTEEIFFLGRASRYSN